MSDLLSNIDKRTKLAGENRLELLLFELGTNQLYGINVFKVREIIEFIPLTIVPKSSPIVRGIANMRGKTFPVFDLKKAIGYEEFPDIEKCYIIITEYNKSIQGFLVEKVNRIVNLDWKDMHAPPAGSGGDSFLTAITNIDDKLIEIIDVEKILQDVSPASTKIEVDTDTINLDAIKGKKILVCDDSRIARKQLKKTLEQLDLDIIEKNDGKQALAYLKDLASKNDKLPDDLLMIVSDIEMPEMDGYKLTTEIRADPLLKDLKVMLHSSLSGVFNNNLVKKVGADSFISKFNSSAIINGISDLLKIHHSK